MGFNSGFKGLSDLLHSLGYETRSRKVRTVSYELRQGLVRRQWGAACRGYKIGGPWS